MSDEKLLPCPKCLGTEISRFEMPWDNFSIQHLIKCADCSISLSGFDEQKLIEAWNTRYQPKCEDCKFLTDELFNDGSARYIKCLVIHAWMSEFECKDFYCKKFERKEG